MEKTHGRKKRKAMGLMAICLTQIEQICQLLTRVVNKSVRVHVFMVLL